MRWIETPFVFPAGERNHDDDGSVNIERIPADDSDGPRSALFGACDGIEIGLVHLSAKHLSTGQVALADLNRFGITGRELFRKTQGLALILLVRGNRPERVVDRFSLHGSDVGR